MPQRHKSPTTLQAPAYQKSHAFRLSSHHRSRHSSSTFPWPKKTETPNLEKIRPPRSLLPPRHPVTAAAKKTQPHLPRLTKLLAASPPRRIPPLPDPPLPRACHISWHGPDLFSSCLHAWAGLLPTPAWSIRSLCVFAKSWMPAFPKKNACRFS